MKTLRPLVSGLVLCALATGVSPASSQPAAVETVRGQVRKQLPDGRLIPGSLLAIQLSPEDSGAPARKTITDWDGLFYLQIVPMGTYRISVEEKGRAAQTFRYDIRRTPLTDVPPIILPSPLKDYRTAYKNALRSIDLKDWSGAAFVLRQVLKLHPESAGSRAEQIRIPGNYIEPYRPHVYLGLALQHLDDCPGALREWAAEENLGPIDGRHREILRAGRKACSTR